MILTPLKVEMLLGLFTMPNFYKQFPNVDSFAQIEALTEFSDNDLLEFDFALQRVSLTLKGLSLVSKILGVTV